MSLKSDTGSTTSTTNCTGREYKQTKKVCLSTFRIDKRLQLRPLGDEHVEQMVPNVDVLPPIALSDDGMVTDGHNRLEAFKRATDAKGKPRKSIPASIWKYASFEDQFDHAVELNKGNLSKPLTRAERKAIGICLHQRGLSDKEISARLGDHISTVNRWTSPLKRQEEGIRNRDIYERRQKGEKIVDVAKIHGLTPGRITQIVQELSETQLRESKEPSPETGESKKPKAEQVTTAALEDSTGDGPPRKKVSNRGAGGTSVDAADQPADLTVGQGIDQLLDAIEAAGENIVKLASTVSATERTSGRFATQVLRLNKLVHGVRQGLEGESLDRQGPGQNTAEEEVAK
jgi:hypothetical protein